MNILKLFLNKKNNKDNEDKTLINSQKELFETAIKRAHEILLANSLSDEDIHPIFTYIKQYTDLITLETAIISNYRHIDGTRTTQKILESRYDNTLEDLIKYISLDTEGEKNCAKYLQKFFYTSHSALIDLKNFPLILNPWNSERIRSNILNVATNKNPFSLEKGSSNLKNHYYYPVGIALCCGGNHSQFSAKLKGGGQSFLNTIIDMSSLYEYMSFDGNHITYNYLDKDIQKYELKKRDEFYVGILFEIGRLLLDFPDIFPKDIKVCLTSSKHYGS